MSIAVLTPRTRWHREAKRAVVRALDKRAVTVEQVKQAHGLTDDEIAEWCHKYGAEREGEAA